MTDAPPSPFASRLREWLPALATCDCFPEISKEVRRSVYHPLGALTLAAPASLRCGLFLHSQGLVLSGGALAVIAVSGPAQLERAGAASPAVGRSISERRPRRHPPAVGRFADHGFSSRSIGQS
jgi:hypothetical protein